MNAAELASIVAILGSLVLVWRGMRNRQIAPSKQVQMAVAWLVIIVGVIFAVQWIGSDTTL